MTVDSGTAPEVQIASLYINSAVVTRRSSLHTTHIPNRIVEQQCFNPPVVLGTSGTWSRPWAGDEAAPPYHSLTDGMLLSWDVLFPSVRSTDGKGGTRIGILGPWWLTEATWNGNSSSHKILWWPSLLPGLLAGMPSREAVNTDEIVSLPLWN